MRLRNINRKLGWAVLVSGMTLALLSGVFVLMTGNAAVLLVSGFGAIGTQAGRVALRDNPAPAKVPNERLRELVAA